MKTHTTVMNFDGLVGPSHNYAGLSHGNVASETHASAVSRPREAALQGLKKMAFVSALGVPQGILPPLCRPRLDVLRTLGFTGNDVAVLNKAAGHPRLLAAVWSASSMWTANAATVTASQDSEDGLVHFTAANLASKLHRSIETEDTAYALRSIFRGPCFSHHSPVPIAFGDEGAANHTRLAPPTGAAVDLFVYGHSALRLGGVRPSRYPARQAREASEAVARKHRVRQPLFVQQAAIAIDAGAFHNDVVAVGHEDLLFLHDRAFENPQAIERIRTAFLTVGGELRVANVAEAELSLADAIKTYLFNSQIVTGQSGRVLIAPEECQRHQRARRVLDRFVEQGVFAQVHTLDLKQSMQNGGGPACLRLRVPLRDEERAQVHPGCVFDTALHTALRSWIGQHYRETLVAADLADPNLIDENHLALDRLTQLLDLGSSFYPFQRG